MTILVESRESVGLRKICYILSFSLLMFVGANIKIPLPYTPVPITLQTLVVYLSIFFLGRHSLTSQLLYISTGMLGIPVFANGGAGIGYLLGPTGGYIVGFILASLIGPFVLPKRRNFFVLWLFFLSIACVIFSSGVFWLIFAYKFSFYKALSLGVFPFFFGEILKISLATIVIFIFRRKCLVN